MLNLIQEYIDHLEDIFENSSDFIYLYDKKGNLLDVNHVFTTKTGYTKEQIFNMKFNDFFVEDEPLIFVEQSKEIIESREKNTSKLYKLKKADGKFLHIEASSIPLKKKGKFYAILGIGHDISTHIKVEQKLKESEEKYYHLFNQTPFNISLFDINGNLIESNSVILKKLAEYAKMDFKGQNFMQIASNFQNSTQINNLLKKRFKDLREKKRLEPIEFNLVTNEGKKIWLRWQSTLVNIGSNKLIQVILEDITEQKEIEQKLKRSEENYRLITENANDLIRVLDDRFEIEFVNELAHFKTLGYSKEELIGKAAIFLNHPDDYTSIRRFIRRMFKTGEDTHESRIRHKNGKYIWFEIKVKMLEDESGNTKYLFISREITDRKEAEKELKESEEKFRAITEQSFMSIMVIQDGILKYFNERLPQRIGYSSEEIKNWGPYEFQKVIHPDDREYVLEQARKKQQGEKDVINNYKYRSLRKDGELRWVENFSKTINYGGRAANLVMSVDITDKLEAERILKESEEKFRNIAEQNFMGILIIQNGELKYINNAMAKISGISIEEIKKWSIKELIEWIHPEDLPNILERLKRNRENTMSPFSHNFFRIIIRNGEVRWLEDYTSKIIYQGKLANLISLVDITDKKKAERLIIEENERLLELDELRKDLITRVSHELKTPMTSIYGANQILLQLYMDQIGKEAQKYIEIGHRGSLRMKQLIDNLLDISRLDAKRFELHLQQENLIDLVVDCVKDMNYLATNRQIKLKLDLSSEILLEVDRLRFRQVLTNIISNAIKNTQEGGEININTIEEPDYVDINIKDTGIGLTEKEKEILFEKFGKIERYGMDLGVDIEGSGLGLYISKEIIELHGGKILVESEGRNKGSIFTVRLFKNSN
ncbi:MAG: PAS domain S-box protein [Promethearchaeota archaeon]